MNEHGDAAAGVVWDGMRRPARYDFMRKCGYMPVESTNLSLITWSLLNTADREILGPALLNLTKPSIT